MCDVNVWALFGWFQFKGAKVSFLGMVVLAAEELATARGLEKADVLRANNSNIKRVYGIDPRNAPASEGRPDLRLLLNRNK